MRILYFAYGSNLSSARLRARLDDVRPAGPAHLADHRLTVDKRGHDGSAKANVVAHPGERVWGVLYDLPRVQLETLDRFEGGYERLEIEVKRLEGGLVAAVTYRSTLRVEDWLPFDWYHAHLVQGAREHGLPAEWIARLEALPFRAGPPEDAGSAGPRAVHVDLRRRGER
ncbi:MAG: gamma-glutamylcyclotransferase family protein [Myxococcota bacterium]|nr:gamma-glutamylcyclotransferase family protein [Myxococcota bacterium]